MAVFATLFPVNLLLILQNGGQLFTGNSATMAMGVLEKKVRVKVRVHGVGKQIDIFVGGRTLGGMMEWL